MSPKGLTQDQLDAYNEDGFVIVRGLFSEDELSPLRTAIDHDPTFDGSEQGIPDSMGRKWNTSVSTVTDNSYIGCLPRLDKMMDIVEDVLGEEGYFWHMKLVRKDRDAGGKVDWHQDYQFWYETVLKPDLVSCSVAVDRNSRANSCVRIARGTHKLGRIDFDRGNVLMADEGRVNEILSRGYEVVDCEMNPGDILVFHPLALHASEEFAEGAERRTVAHCTYNARSNVPIPAPGQEHRQYTRTERLPSSYLKERLFDSVFAGHEFMDNKKLNLVKGTILY